MRQSSAWRPWPRRLLAQTVVLAFLALAAAQGATLWLSSRQSDRALKELMEASQVRQVATIVNLMNSSPIDLRERLLAIWIRPGLRLYLASEPSIQASDTQDEVDFANDLQLSLDDEDAVVRMQRSRSMSASRVSALLRDDRTADQLRVMARLRVETIFVSVELEDGSWLELAGVFPTLPFDPQGQSTRFSIVAFLAVMTVLIWRLRRITKPLEELEKAANSVGRGTKVEAISESGPEDLRTAIRAFNAMNTRVEQFVAERTRMLAALSHDIRTPLTSMRLRLEMMRDSDEKRQLVSGLDEMEQMAEATLAYIREDRDAEQIETVDVTALLASVCDDYIDMGQAVEFDYGTPILLTARPLSLRRAVRNVIDNAVRYGNCAQVTVEERRGTVTIAVQDHGPGIDPAMEQAVFEPFERGESSRSRATGGNGLGLAIAQQIVVQHGGTIELRNNERGLRVALELPMAGAGGPGLAEAG